MKVVGVPFAQDNRDGSRSRGGVGQSEGLAYFGGARQGICLDLQSVLAGVIGRLDDTHEANDRRLSSGQSSERADEDGFDEHSCGGFDGGCERLDGRCRGRAMGEREEVVGRLVNE